ncbi:MAG: TusE/DsrC/DsvC family sulfur relay protein [bacterium]
MAMADQLSVERMTAPTNFEDWTEAAGKEAAAELGLELTDAHWEVVYFLRNHCKEHGTSCTARQVIRALSERFEDRGGKKFLYSLFPDGPILQACAVAGLPLPANTLDLSFGTTH